jgi:hypothetical protein
MQTVWQKIAKNCPKFAQNFALLIKSNLMKNNVIFWQKVVKICVLLRWILDDLKKIAP